MLNWKGKELVTYGDIMDAILACETPEEMRACMDAYRAENPHADGSIGYMTGYYDNETAKRVKRWLGVRHPIFDGHDPTPKEAFGAGKKWAGESRAGKEAEPTC